MKRDWTERWKLLAFTAVTLLLWLFGFLDDDEDRATRRDSKKTR